MRSETVVAPLALLLCGATAAQTRAIRVTCDDEVVRVFAGEALALAYRATGHPWKAYAEQLCTPAGTNVLRVSPPDHVHHRGLIFALGADDHDYWGEHYVERPGRQLGRPITAVTARATDETRAASFAHDIDWVAGSPSQRHVREQRWIDVRPRPDVTLVTWRTELTVPEGHAPVRLWGRPYFGLGLRFVSEMDADGRFSCANGARGEVVRGDERIRRSTWCAYTAGAGAGEVTVAMFDHPDNPRHPAAWFTMAKPFAFLAATLALTDAPLELHAGAPLRLCHGIALFDGALEPEHIERHYQGWLVACARVAEQRK